MKEKKSVFEQIMWGLLYGQVALCVGWIIVLGQYIYATHFVEPL